MINPFKTPEQRAEDEIPKVSIHAGASIARGWVLATQVVLGALVVACATHTMLPAAVPYTLFAYAVVVAATVRIYAPTLMYSAIFIAALSFLTPTGRAVSWKTLVIVACVVAMVRTHSVLSLSSRHSTIEASVLFSELKWIAVSTLTAALLIGSAVFAQNLSNGPWTLALIAVGVAALIGAFVWALDVFRSRD